MLRLSIIIALATGACTHKHAGKGVVAGLGVTALGAYAVYDASHDEEAGIGNAVGITLALTGVLVVVANAVMLAEGEPTP